MPINQIQIKSLSYSVYYFSLWSFKYFFLIYLWLLWVVTAASRGYSLAVVHSLLTAVASLVAELGL